MEKDEELGDNVMHRGAERGGGASRGERGGRGGMLEEEEERAAEGEHRVCASGTRRQGKIAWARLAGRVCLCLIEEGCETQTPHWLEFYWNAATERWTLTHMPRPHMHTFVQRVPNMETEEVTGEYKMRRNERQQSSMDGF